MNVDGNCYIISTNDTVLKQHGQLSLITVDKDDDEQVTVEEHTPQGRHIISRQEKLDAERLVINNGEEPFVLGQKLKAFLDDFIDELSKITVTTAIGQMTILNKAQIMAFKNKTEPLLSQVAFLDR